MNQDIKWHPHPEYPYWLNDPDGDGITFYRTAEDRDAAAAETLDEYKDADGCWTEEVEGVCAGVVTHIAQCKNKVMRPPEDELDEEGCDGEGAYWGDFEWMGNYTLEPIKEEKK